MLKYHLVCFFPILFVLLMPATGGATEEIIVAPNPTKGIHQGKRTRSKKQKRSNEKQKKAMRVRWGTRAAVEYTSNIFHEKERRLVKFQTKTGPLERYDGMKGPGDVVIKTKAQVGIRFPYGEKNLYAKGYAAIKFDLPTRNPKAHRFEIVTGGDLAATKRDKVALKLSLIPYRFKKNYKSQSGGKKVYVPATYLDFMPNIAYGHLFGKSWKLSAAYQLRVRRFNALFGNRNETRHKLSVLSQHQVYSTVSMLWGVNAGIGLTPKGSEFGIPVDRSNVTTGAKLGLAMTPMDALRVTFKLAYRMKRYLTSETTNRTHYRRTDHRVGVALGSVYALIDDLFLNINVGWLRNFAGRIDTGFATGEAYQEITIGAGLSYTM